MTPKIIKTEADHSAALARLDVIFDAHSDTPEGEEAALLALLIEKYEAETVPIAMPTALEAIRFRMEHQNLKNKDLIPYIGSASKVSEVLAGKRALSPAMMCNLHEGLGISAAVLLQRPGAKLAAVDELELAKKMPITEMAKRGWFAGFAGTPAKAKAQWQTLVRDFIAPLGANTLLPAYNRQSVRHDKPSDANALMAWRIRVACLALQQQLPAYQPGCLTASYLKKLVQMSALPDGPLRARAALQACGIHVVFERHLPKTKLDGAALRLPNGAPVVALTLRHDRLDNFWFTLVHELAHVVLHLDKGGDDVFIDDLSDTKTKDPRELEADQFASNALIPDAEWRQARLSTRSSAATVQAFAARLGISPAIPAGRIRQNNYTVLHDLIGQGSVRKLFEPAVLKKPVAAKPKAAPKKARA